MFLCPARSNLVAWLIKIALLISVVMIILNLPRGFGKHIYAVDPANLSDIGLTSNIAGTFSILAASLSKTSFAVTLLRILKGRTRYLVWFIIATINITMSLSALLGWVQCSPIEKVWRVTVPGTCWPPSGKSLRMVSPDKQLTRLDSTSVRRVRHGSSR